MDHLAAIWPRVASGIRFPLRRFEPPDSLVLVLTAVLVGVGTGLGAVAFIGLLDGFETLVDWLRSDLLGGLDSAASLMAIMGAAGLAVGLIVHYWAEEAKGSGVPEVMEAVALRGGRIRARVAPVKILASTLTIGSGGSAGREGPIVQAGSALGSALGQTLRLSDDRIRTMVACGAAAGIAATFNAPIAGSIFALEVILGRFTTRYFGAVVISSVAAGIIARVFLGSAPAFIVPAYPLSHLGELVVYLALGILAAFVAVLFIRVLYRTKKLLDQWGTHPALKATAGMILAAIIGSLAAGETVLGPGLGFIGDAIAADFSMPVTTMIVLLLLKLLATSFTLGAGNSGGVFAPALFMGAMLGGIVGNVAQGWWPGVVIHPGAYAIVGMAAVFAGAARAPIAAVLIVFEMSNDYQLILPLMLATVVATLLAEQLFEDSVYTLKLRLKGIVLQQGRDVDLMQGMSVGEAMTANPYVVERDMPLVKLGQFFHDTHSHSFPVVDREHNLVGMVSITDFDRAAERGPLDSLMVEDIATMNNILVAYDNEPLSSALQRIGVRSVNKLPVLAHTNPQRVVGVIRRRDIIRAYNIALARRAKEQAQEDRLRLRHIDNTEFLDIEILPDSPAANLPLADIAPRLPEDCVVVSVRRHDSILIPHGDTVLRPGDLVSVFLRRTDETRLRNCFLNQASPLPEE